MQKPKWHPKLAEKMEENSIQLADTCRAAISLPSNGKRLAAKPRACAGSRCD